MYSTFLLRWTSQILSVTLGSMAIFCLYYAVVLGNPRILMQALKYGGPAVAIVYCQTKYLSQD
jgi:hypothetical protein